MLFISLFVVRLAIEVKQKLKKKKVLSRGKIETQ